ncbi:MAG: hypothetical protein ACK551_04360 [Vampirovibrionales bacterium]
MRFSTMTSLSNAPSRLTFPLPSTTVQTQRTGSVYDYWFPIQEPIQGNSIVQTPQSESDAKMLTEIVNTFIEENKARLDISNTKTQPSQQTLSGYSRAPLNICYNPKHDSNQSLESYLKWLDDIKLRMKKKLLDFAIVDAPHGNNALSINISRYTRQELEILKQLLSENLLLI